MNYAFEITVGDNVRRTKPQSNSLDSVQTILCTQAFEYRKQDWLAEITPDFMKCDMTDLNSGLKMTVQIIEVNE